MDLKVRYFAAYYPLLTGCGRSVYLRRLGAGRKVRWPYTDSAVASGVQQANSYTDSKSA
jgi:hypothetical protein